MRRDGTVVSVEGETALLASVVRTCAGCSGAHCSVRTRQVVARAPQALRLSPGDRVEYELSLPRAMLVALLLFGALPLLFLAGFLALRSTVPAAAEPLAALAGLFTVALGLGVLYRSAGRGAVANGGAEHGGPANGGHGQTRYGETGSEDRRGRFARGYSELPLIVRKLPASGSETDE